MSPAGPPRGGAGWFGLALATGQAGAPDLSGGVPAQVTIAHAAGFDGYSAYDGGLVFAPGGSYEVAVVARGQPQANLAELSQQLYDYFDEHTWSGQGTDR